MLTIYVLCAYVHPTKPLATILNNLYFMNNSWTQKHSNSENSVNHPSIAIECSSIDNNLANRQPESGCVQHILVTPGAHRQEPATTPYSCHGVFTNRSIFSLNLSRIQIPTGTSVTNCNHKHGLMSTFNMFTWSRIVLFLPMGARVDWNWPILRVKYLKIDWSVKMPFYWLIVGDSGS